MRCYNCSEKGHYSSSCPKRTLYCGRTEDGADGQDRARRHGTVNGVYCTNILVDTGATQTPNSVFNFDDSLFPPAGPSKPTLTRAQKREDRRQYRCATEEAGYGQPGALDVTPEELCNLQDDDESLRRSRLIADGEPGAAAREKFFRQDGLVYRQYSPTGSNDDTHSIDQLVLPTQLGPAVLKLAHDIPMAGHLGRKKMADRILQRF